MSRFLAQAMSKFTSKPVLKASGAILGLDFANQIVGKPLYNNFFPQGEGLDGVARARWAERDAGYAERLSAARMQKSMQRNLETIQRARPDLYQRVVTGLDLPDGSVVIGGAPRMDLAQRLAYLMASGQLGDPGDPEEKVLAEMGIRAKRSTKLGPQGFGETKVAYTMPGAGPVDQRVDYSSGNPGLMLNQTTTGAMP